MLHQLAEWCRIFGVGIFNASGPRSPLGIRQPRNAATVVAQKADSVTNAFTACEYSHCRRSTSQFSNRRDQLAVAEFTGWVQRTKMARLTTSMPAAVIANQKAARSSFTT